MATTAPIAPSIPGPAPMPLLGARGNFIAFLRDPISYSDHVYHRYGSLASMTRGDLAQVLAFSPDYNRLLLSDTRRFYTIFETITSERICIDKDVARCHASYEDGTMPSVRSLLRYAGARLSA